MRAGVELERIVAGALLLTVAAYAAVLGSGGILAGVLGPSGVDGPRQLPAPVALAALGAALTWLSLVVLAGRRPQQALGVATLLVGPLAVVAALGGAWRPITILLAVVAVTSVATLLIGRYRIARR